MLNRHPKKFVTRRAALFLALLLSLPAGCGLGGEKTVTSDVTVTVPPPEIPSPPEEIRDYKSAISGITSEADSLNNEFREMVDGFNRREVTVNEVIDRSDLNWRTYEQLSQRLTEMKVPREFQEAHRQLISGFGKWQAAFQTYRDGFRENNSPLLDRARELDGQAVIEVNQAISSIQQIQG